MEELGRIYEHGVFLRRHAIESGYSDRDLRRELRDKRLVRVRHGAYIDSGRWIAQDDVQQHALRGHAVLLTHETPVALSHTTGAAMQGMRLWGSDLRRVHVTRLGAVAARKHHDVAYHDMPALRDGALAASLPTLSPAHCALGTASLHSVEVGTVVLDSALNLGLCSSDDLQSAYRSMSRWPGTGRLQVTLRLVDGGSESVGESRARYLFWRHGIPRPTSQFPVYDGSALVGIADFAWPEHRLIVEFDGRIKYESLLRPGETASDVVFREKRREDRIREVTGYRVVRLTWVDLEHPARTAERLHRFF